MVHIPYPYPYCTTEQHRILKYVVSEFKNHQAHQTQKKVVENIQEYLNLIKYSTYFIQFQL